MCWGRGWFLQGMGVVFSLTADDDVVCRQALACLRGILNLPNLPPSLSVFEIMVSIAGIS